MTEPNDFLAAMSRIGASVHVVTSGLGASCSGSTATAVCSVSADPPTILACLNVSSRTAELVRESGKFVVNTLSGGHESISNMFAGRSGASGREKFSVGDWVVDDEMPILRDASVVLRCKVAEIHRMASHFVIFGRVSSIVVGPNAPALVYYQREYHQLDQQIRKAG